MERSPSWETDSLSAGQEIPRLLWKPKICYTMFTWSLSSARRIQSATSHHVYLSSITILSSHLRLDLPSSLFPSGFPTNIFIHFLYLTRDSQFFTSRRNNVHSWIKVVRLERRRILRFKNCVYPICRHELCCFVPNYLNFDVRSLSNVWDRDFFVYIILEPRAIEIKEE
jgi:hypothetical protein